jgi:hypothetical protein
MTTMQTLLGKILTHRINEEKVKGTTDFIEIKNTLDIFLAGRSITSEQYAELISLVNPTVITTENTVPTNTNATQQTASPIVTP